MAKNSANATTGVNVGCGAEASCDEAGWNCKGAMYALTITNGVTTDNSERLRIIHTAEDRTHRY